MGIMRCKKMRMGHSKPEVIKQKSKGLVESPWVQRIKNTVIRPGKPKRVGKNSWECRVRKWAKDAQEKQMGQGSSRRKKWDKGAHEQCNGLREPKVTWV